MDLMELGDFRLERTNLFFSVKQRNKLKKQVTTAMSMPTEFMVEINHSFRRLLYVGTEEGNFLQTDENERLLAMMPIAFDLLLFAFKDDSVYSGVHQVLFTAGINQCHWEAISEAVMAEGLRMMKGNLEVYKDWNSKCPGSFNDTLQVLVGTEEAFVCFEDVGES